MVGTVVKQDLAQMGATPGMDTFTASVPITSTFGPDYGPPNVKESRDIAHCEPQLRDAWPLIQQRFKAETGRDLFLTCTYRSRERQNELYQQGRTLPGKIVTKLDGINKRSRHNFFPSQALDCCVDSDPGPGKHPVWDIEAYKPLGPICLQLGLRWGGDWNRDGDSSDEKWIDAPHVELI